MMEVKNTWLLNFPQCVDLLTQEIHSGQFPTSVSGPPLSCGWFHEKHLPQGAA